MCTCVSGAVAAADVVICVFSHTHALFLSLSTRCVRLCSCVRVIVRACIAKSHIFVFLYGIRFDIYTHSLTCYRFVCAAAFTHVHTWGLRERNQEYSARERERQK